VPSVHIVLVMPRWVGDAVMATPLLCALRTHLGRDGRITGVMRPVVAELLHGADWFDAVVPYDRAAAADTPTLGFRAVAKTLRTDRADVAVVLPNSLSSAALVWAGGARRRIGHVGHWRRGLLTDVVPAPPRPLPPPESFLALAAPLGAPLPATGCPRLTLATTSADEAHAEDALARLFPQSTGPLVILNDNGAHGPSKAWGVERCVGLARWLLPRLPGCRLLVHCGPGDREAARAVAAGADHAAVQSLADLPDLPIGLSKALYRRAALSISSDSGPRHIGAAFGVPTVALVGPIDPLCGRSDPERCIEVRVDLPCSPCGRPTCPLGHHDCMRLLTPERVGAAALELLARHGAERRAS
jgi:heptosyltransferase-2